MTTSTNHEEETVLRVSSSSSVTSVGSAIAHAVYDSRRVVLRAVGAGAVNQAMKAAAVARGYVAPRGFDLSVRPAFTSIPGRDGKDISAMSFIVITT